MSLCSFFREKSVVELLQEVAVQQDSPQNCVTLDRGLALKQFMDELLNPKFNPAKTLNVKFRAEIGVDSGAITSTLIEICKEHIGSLPIFEDNDEGLRLKPNRKGILK